MLAQRAQTTTEVTFSNRATAKGIEILKIFLDLEIENKNWK